MDGILSEPHRVHNDAQNEVSVDVANEGQGEGQSEAPFEPPSAAELQDMLDGVIPGTGGLTMDDMVRQLWQSVRDLADDSLHEGPTEDPGETPIDHVENPALDQDEGSGEDLADAAYGGPSISFIRSIYEGLAEDVAAARDADLHEEVDLTIRSLKESSERISGQFAKEIPKNCENPIENHGEIMGGISTTSPVEDQMQAPHQAVTTSAGQSQTDNFNKKALKVQRQF